MYIAVNIRNKYDSNLKNLNFSGQVGEIGIVREKFDGCPVLEAPGRAGGGQPKQFESIVENDDDESGMSGSPVLEAPGRAGGGRPASDASETAYFHTLESPSLDGGVQIVMEAEIHHNPAATTPPESI